jgi:UDP-glucuronate 4-epimerase
MRVLVTGGAGFIGSHLVERLLNEGHEVTCLDNFDDFYDPRLKRENLRTTLTRDQFRLYEGDFRDAELLDRLFKEIQPELVIHLGARAGVRPSIEDPLLYYDINVNGSLRLLEAMRNHGVERALIASSSSVYGNNEKVPFAESDPVDHPISPYAATKKAVELLSHTWHHLWGLKIAQLRFFTVYGPRQRPEMAIHKFTRLIEQGKSIPFFGDGSSRRDYTYIDDIIDGIICVMQSDFSYDIVNLGESQTNTLATLVDLIGRELGKKPKLEMLPLQPGDVTITFADISHARQQYGYNPTTPLADGIRKFTAWYLENKN